MSADRAAMQDLAQGLMRGRTDRLSAAELDALLSWLGGGQRHGALHLADNLGRPDSHPEMLAALYRLLDNQLLGEGRLDPDAAHLNPSRPAAEVRARFRRLIQAFHPDRYPELAAWLTPRSQLIHHAYAAFKRGKPWPQSNVVGTHGSQSAATTQVNKAAGTVDRAAHPWQPGPFRHSARLAPESRSPLQRFTQTLRRSPGLARGLIVAVAVIGLAPLLFFYWSDGPSHRSDALNTTVPAAAIRPADRAAGPSEIHPAAVAPTAVLSSLPPPAPAHEAAGSEAASPAPTAELEMMASASENAEVGESSINLLLQRFGRYVSGGDLDGLLRLIDPPRSDPGIDRMVDYYDRVISESRRRHQEFQVLSIEYQTPYWSVQTLSRLTMAFDDHTARHEEARYRMTLRLDEDGQLRIASFDG